MEKYLFLLRNTAFFSGMTDAEILSVLHCVEGRLVHREAGEYIFRAGEAASECGMVLSGCLLITQTDLWGRRNIMSKCLPGDFFGEPYAATPGSVLNISVSAVEDSDILMLNVERLLTTCPTACEHHSRLIRNLVSVMAGKVLKFNDKITHMSRRTTREKLLSYLSAESVRQGKLSFDIPYDRQQLADYLCVERSAMSSELSKLKKEGLLETKGSHFVIKPEAADLSTL
ncbi:MAG: Crp/Fnr family transcriptional regulator [Eubacterium sp.]|nr:Crp/Fnr family transcriptional regulator [Eubacterium sp.]